MRSAYDERSPEQRREYPLIEARVTRQDCLNLIADEGLPRPPRSSCYFCPFHNKEAWSRLARTRPDLFEKAAQVEDLIAKRSAHLGRGDFRLTDTGLPLREAFNGDQQVLFGDDDDPGCESGYCMT